MLAGFARVALEPGQARKVRFTVHPSRLAFYDPQMRFVTGPGAFAVCVGSSSTDIKVSGVVELGDDIAKYCQREILATTVEII